MALNPYFQAQIGVPSEQNIVEQMAIESIQIAGVDCVYLPRTLGKLDQVLGEDNLSSFDSHAIVECWIGDYTGYGGEGEMIAKFGLEVRDTCTMIIARKRFTDVVVPIVPSSRNATVKWRPNEGDLIYIPNSQSLFEIKFVEDEEPSFYQLNKKYVWELRCELTQLNNETFNTGYGTPPPEFVTDPAYTSAIPYDDVLGFGDDDELKQEFLDIMDFSKKNPLAGK